MAGAGLWAGFDPAAKELGHGKGAEVAVAKKITAEIEKDLFRQLGGDPSANGVREGERVTCELQACECLGKGLAGKEVVSDQVP